MKDEAPARRGANLAARQREKQRTGGVAAAVDGHPFAGCARRRDPRLIGGQLAAAIIADDDVGLCAGDGRKAENRSKGEAHGRFPDFTGNIYAYCEVIVNAKCVADARRANNRTWRAG